MAQMLPGTLIAFGESEKLNYRSRAGTRYETVQTANAMFNQRGGHVLFGVTLWGGWVG